MAKFNHIHSKPVQGGAALIVSMVMLAVITIIGVTVMSGSHLEWLMATNNHLQTSAFMKAEDNLSTAFDTSRTTFDSPATINTFPWATPDNIFNDDPIAATPDPIPTGPAGPDHIANWNGGTFSNFIIDYLGASTINIGSSNFFVYSFRIWAYGSDGKGAARVIKSTYMGFGAAAASVPTAFQPCTPNAADTICWYQTGAAEIP